jgi:hypothetical protein
MSFIEAHPTREDYWRSIILFGRNVASYKFALAKSLLEIASSEKTFVRLDELAETFSRHVTEHLGRVDKQITSSSSRFLDVCRQFNRGEINKESLTERTVVLGFQNVIDAFHVVNRAPIPTRFFQDERKQRSGLVITDGLLKLKENFQFQNLPFETEARWRLVETAWELDLHPALLNIRYDDETALFFVAGRDRRRIDVTSSRDALDGYQKGKCFYCGLDISVVSFSENQADVDHFFPHTLLVRSENVETNLNGIWNLVLACRGCNRGANGKSARVPALQYLERLHRRNNYLIESHHPLRETLMAQTGTDETSRHKFLQLQYDAAKSLLIHEWKPEETFRPCF